MTGLHWLAWVVGHAVAAVVLHESSHALVGVLHGGRLAAAGFLPRAPGAEADAMMRGVGVKVLPPHGAATWSPGAWALVVAAGPLGNVLTAIGMAWLGTGAWTLAALVHVTCALANLLPSRGEGPPSDGQQLWRWFSARG